MDGGFPLVIVLHGARGTGPAMRDATNFDRYADDWGVAVAYPDGYQRGWADGRGVTSADSDGVDDVAFVRALIDWSAERYGTRPDHTIVAGISNGAFMAHRIALEASDRVAAFCAVAGALPDALREVRPTHAVSALLINGDADRLVSLDGGYSRHRGPNGELRGRILSQRETVEHWRDCNRCSGTGEFESTPSPAEKANWLGLTRHTITGGVGGTRVESVTVHGGGHSWPGSTQFDDPRIIEAIGPIAQNFDTAVEIMRFALPLLTTTRRLSHDETAS